MQRPDLRCVPADGPWEARPPLRGCLLSGGLSRRMGQDKALLPHPAGGTWLEHALRLLLTLERPVTLFSRHERHLQLARELRAEPAGGIASPEATRDQRHWVNTSAVDRSEASAAEQGWIPRLTALAEPPPWEGPLLALERLVQRYPGQCLLLCPVDMPRLTPQVLRTLLQASAEEPQRIHLAHDGERCQPLLGVYPSTPPLRAELTAAVHRGERRMQRWLEQRACRYVPLDPRSLCNLNSPEELNAENACSWPGR